jgi:hypothetical protein
MLRRFFRRRFKIGDRVRLVRTGQNAVIVNKGTLPVARKHLTTFTLKFGNGTPALTVLPEEIERAA